MNSRKRARRPRLAIDDQPVSFAELFFDLVFVFAVTQVVHLLDETFDLAHLGGAMLVFWLVWWAWTQYTWALNAADTRNHVILAGTLLATVCAFFMAVSLPGAFGANSLWFAMAYIAVRCIGLALYIWVSSVNRDMRKAVMTFTMFSVAGLVSALAGGIFGGKAQFVFWGLAIVLDVMAASFGGRREGWNLHARHFTERHGLFVIIALGETLIIAASAAASDSWNTSLMIVSMLAVGITSAFWWIYFYRVKEVMEQAMIKLNGIHRSEMGRDVYSLFHFPMICGLIIYAYAIEEAMLNPQHPLADGVRLALALGLFLYAGTQVLAFFRATGRILYIRLIGACGIALTCYVISGVGAIESLAIVLGGLGLLVLIEEKAEDRHHAHA